MLDYAMCKAKKERKEGIEFKLDQRRSRYLNPTVVTNTMLTDDLILINKEFQITWHMNVQFMQIFYSSKNSVVTST